VVLEVWRQRRGPKAGSDVFMDENLPFLMDENLPLQSENTEDEEDEGDVEAMTVDAVISSPEQHQSDEPDVLDAVAVTASPEQHQSDEPDVLDAVAVTASLAPSAPPTSVPITQPPSKKTAIATKSGLPMRGTLTDRPTNIITHASRRVR